MTSPDGPARGRRTTDIAAVLRTDAALDRIAADRRYHGVDPALRLVGALVAHADGGPGPWRRARRRDRAIGRAYVAAGTAVLVMSISEVAAATVGVGPLTPVFPEPIPVAAPGRTTPPHPSGRAQVARAVPRNGDDGRPGDVGDRPRHGTAPRPVLHRHDGRAAATLATGPRHPAPAAGPTDADRGSGVSAPGTKTADPGTPKPQAGSAGTAQPAALTARPDRPSPTPGNEDGATSPTAGNENAGTHTRNTPGHAGNAHARSARDHTGRVDPPARSPSPSFLTPPTPSSYDENITNRERYFRWISKLGHLLEKDRGVAQHFTPVQISDRPNRLTVGERKSPRGT